MTYLSTYTDLKARNDRKLQLRRIQEAAQATMLQVQMMQLKAQR